MRYINSMQGSAGIFIASVSAIDADVGQNGEVSYQLFGPEENYFSINSVTGNISVSDSGIDFEIVNAVANPITLMIFAQDNGEF